MNRRYRVLIADDHPLARRAIKSLLEADPAFELVGEATNGEEAFRLCGELQPDLILLDIRMPGWDGLKATQEIKRNFPAVKVVILSVSDDIGDLFTAIQFGAQGYLLKNLDPDDWLTYLHGLIQETGDIPREMAGKLFYQFREEIRPDEPHPSILTPREREIIGCVAAGETNRQIASRLVITENTVKNHIKNVLEKLHLENRVQLAAYAVRHGLINESTKK